MKILGIDPGLIKTGYGLVKSDIEGNMKLVEAGVIRTDSKDCIADRVSSIYTNLVELIKEYSPSVLVLEKIYSNYKHPATAILMGHARGVVCLAAGLNNVELYSYEATRIKKAVTGNGRASKQQIQRTVKNYLGLKTDPKPVDITDALAMAISYVFIEGIGC